MRTARYVPNDEQVHGAILYLFELGYGKDAICLILNGITKSGRINRFLLSHGLSRTKEEAIAIKVKNKIGCNDGYVEIRKKLWEKFPSLRTT
jgi:hypothetical protein